MSKISKIKRMLVKGKGALEIAKALGVSNAYVHTVKWQMKRQAADKKLTSVVARGVKLPAAFFAVKKSQPDLVNRPPHYTEGGIETIDFIEAKDLNYRLGNVIKYVSRAEKKENPLVDLKKAAWYLNREIATRERA